MASERARDAAYTAGRAAYATEPPARRTPDGCPFSVVDHPDERAAWLEGFADEMDAEPDRAAIRRQLNAAREELK